MLGWYKNQEGYDISKKYSVSGISGRKSVTGGPVVSNVTKSRKKVGRFWVRICSNIFLHMP